jgi:2-phospho-L-lactate transferase/gluconeogenesis factor (CofD/UPF0052 family)
VCNVATQIGETDGFSVGDHIEALQRHVGRDVFHHVLVNDNFNVKLNPNTELVPLEYEAEGDYQVVSADLIDPQKPWRHDSQKLARHLMDFYYSQGKPAR